MFGLAYDLPANKFFFLKILFGLDYFCKILTKKENYIVLGKKDLFRVEGKYIDIYK